MKEYLLSITGAAILCSIIKQLLGEKNAGSKLIRMICGVFMSVAVLAPIVHFRLGNLKEYFSEFQISGEEITEQGTSIGKNARNEIIAEQTRAYIVNEATKLGAQIDVSVSLSNEDPPVPIRIKISGNISPYAKSKLSETVRNCFNIPGESIVWT